MGQLFEPNMIFRYIGNAFLVATGNTKINDAFDLSSTGFWQAIAGSWLVGMVLDSVSVFLSDSGLSVSLRAHFLLLNALVPLVAILFFASATFHILNLAGRADRFVRFLVPYIWIKTLFGLIISLLALGALVTGNSWLIFIILPTGFWFLTRLFRIAREQTGLGGWAAIGLLVGDLVIHVALGMTALPGMMGLTH